MKKGWQITKLGDVCAFDKVQGIHRGLPYVGLEHIESHTARFIGSSSPQSVKSSTFRFSYEHVLYGRLRPYLNKALAPDFEGHCSTEIFPLKPSRELSREYLLYWLLADETCELIDATCTGARMPRAQMNEVMDFDFPLPPLAEQQRIVGLLDEAFEGLATAKATAQKNLQNARALFESHLQTVLRNKKWKWKTLGDLCEYVEYGSSAKSKAEGGVPVLRMGNIQDGRLNWENLVYTDDKAEIKKYLLKHNDVLFNRTNSPELVGKTAIYKSEMPAIFAGYLIRIHRKEDLLDGDFLTYFLNSQIAFDYGKTVVISSVNQANINGTKLKGYPIPAPSLSEQKAIVAKLNDLSEETQRLARLYEQKLAALEALKKSLLHQAFTGEL
jgi:type I restriction enzyme S subunit